MIEEYRRRYQNVADHIGIAPRVLIADLIKELEKLQQENAELRNWDYFNRLEKENERFKEEISGIKRVAGYGLREGAKPSDALTSIIWAIDDLLPDVK